MLSTSVWIYLRETSFGWRVSRPQKCFVMLGRWWSTQPGTDKLQNNTAGQTGGHQTKTPWQLDECVQKRWFGVCWSGGALRSGGWPELIWSAHSAAVVWQSSTDPRTGELLHILHPEVCSTACQQEQGKGWSTLKICQLEKWSQLQQFFCSPQLTPSGHLRVLCPEVLTYGGMCVCVPH